MNTRIVTFAAAAVFAPILSAQYQYYHSEDLYPFNSAYWTITTPPSEGYPCPSCYSSSYYSQGGYGGMGGLDASFMGPFMDPYQSGGEVRMVVRVDPNFPWGTFYAYLAGNYDANGNLPLDGTEGVFFDVAVDVAASTVYLNIGAPDPSTGNFTEHQLYGTTAAIHDGSVVRSVLKPYGNGSSNPYAYIIVYVDGTLVANFPVSFNQSLPQISTSGAFGFGIETTTYQGQGQGNLLQHVDFGYLDTTPPNPVPATSINTSATFNQININWPATTDGGSNGTGIYGYQIYRSDGQYYNLLATITANQSLSYVDTSNIAPDTVYQYRLDAIDYHWNVASTYFSVPTPNIPTNGPYPSSTPDGRRVGVRPTGAYWGGTNENIDVLSGNLNFSLPLLIAKARGGVSVPFNLVYNAQMWRHDSGGDWIYDGDVGYGFGWRVLTGALIPVWNPGGFTASQYIFIDSTGAEYHLNQNTGSIWSSKESIFVYFDASTTLLHFRNGTTWTLGCISAATEPDSGVMYPTQIEDTNGNLIQISYQTAQGASWANSSSRITSISDVRSQTAYTFTYNSDTPPHLTSITNGIQTGEAYTFTYSSESIASPFDQQSFGTAAMLASAAITNLNMTHTFSYDGSGELTKIVLPYGGYLAYDYTTTNYSSGISYREVHNRHLASDGTSGTDIVYPIAHEASPGYIHSYTTIDDPSGTGEKYWAIGSNSFSYALVTGYQGRQMPGQVAKTQNAFTWSQDGVGNSYIATSLTTLDPGQSYQAQTKTTQTVDNYGNVLQVQNYDYNSLSTPIRTYTYTYLHTNSSTYTNLYILNRMTGASVVDNAQNGATLASVIYDQYGVGGTYCTGYGFPALASASPTWGWDTNFSNTNVTARGNPVMQTTPSGATCIAYDVTGNPVSTVANGVTTQVSSWTNNLAVPTQLSVGSLTTTLGWSSFLGLTNETGPNGDTASTAYDEYARPSGSTSPFGAVTTVAYSSPPYSTSNPPTITSTINGRWTMKTLDGLGRTVLTSSGDTSGTKSQAESVYGPCACSPMGKLMQQAMPHAPNGNPAWTVYTYDGIGRTLSVLSPDGASTTTYLYQGNTVKVTDPAGNWKIFTMNALGNLVQVTEPNPGSN